MKTCENCGTKIYGGVCSNCQEELYILENQADYLEHPISEEFLTEANRQREENKRCL